MSYENFIGKEYPSFSAEIEKGRIRQFAGAIGESNPVYTDEKAANEAGYASLPAPPTFPFSLAMDAGQSFNILEDMEINISRAVHAAQGFTYKLPICAGDEITGVQKITGVFEKKGGALLFIEAEIDMVNQNGDSVCNLQTTVIVRNG